MTTAQPSAGNARQVRELGVAIAGNGRLIRNNREVRLSRRETAAVATLLDHVPGPVPAADFSRLLWRTTPSERARRATMARFRRQLSLVGLALRYQTRMGYTLVASPWVLDCESRR